jgi:hypothetical protein
VGIFLTLVAPKQILTAGLCLLQVGTPFQELPFPNHIVTVFLFLPATLLQMQLVAKANSLFH